MAPRSLRLSTTSSGGGGARGGGDLLLALQRVDSTASLGDARRRSRNADGATPSKTAGKGEDFDPLELEEEGGYGGSGGFGIGPTLDWVEFRHAVRVNREVVVETTATGDKKHVVDLHVKAKRKDTSNGSMSVVDLGTNLDNSHRLTLETTNITDDRGSTVQCTLSTRLPVNWRGADDGRGGLALLPSFDWGLATHTRVGKRTTVFSRLFSDEIFGQQLVLQASYHVRRGALRRFATWRGKRPKLSAAAAEVRRVVEAGTSPNLDSSAAGAVAGSSPGDSKEGSEFGGGGGRPAGLGVGRRLGGVVLGGEYLVSALGAVNFGYDLGGGVSVTKLFSRRDWEEGGKRPSVSADSLELKALCARSGNHSLSLNANFGVMAN